MSHVQNCNCLAPKYFAQHPSGGANPQYHFNSASARLSTQTKDVTRQGCYKESILCSNQPQKKPDLGKELVLLENVNGWKLLPVEMRQSSRVFKNGVKIKNKKIKIGRISLLTFRTIVPQFTTLVWEWDCREL